MTRSQKKVTRTLCERFKARLGLSGHRIRVGINDDPEWDRKGEAEGIYGQAVGIVTIRADLDFDTARQTLCHEMLHVRFWLTWSGVGRIKTAMGKRCYRVWVEGWRENHEHEIDALALALCASFDDSDLAGRWANG